MTANLIPVISLKKFLANPEGELERTAQEIDHALTTCGLFILKDHGIDCSITENCMRDLTTFFKLPVEKKRIFQGTSLQHGRGFIPFEADNINATMGRSGYPNDAMERFAFGRVKPLPGDFSQDCNDLTKNWVPNIYSSEPSRFKESVENFYEDFLEKRCSSASHLLNCMHYQVVEDPPPGQDRIALHTDLVPFAVLFPDQSKEGLRAQTVQGNWIAADAPPGCFIILIGECMEIMTSKYYAAVPHVVPFPSDPANRTARTSVGFFPQMNENALVETVPKFLNEKQTSNYDPILFRDISDMKSKNLHKKR